jgi:polysaccharide deacetylase family protein (PEP-CTERM system associated)
MAKHAKSTSIVFSFDVEDNTGLYRADGRYVDNCYRVLDFLDELGVRGTIFVVGKAAEVVPKMVREFATRGHELACHGYAHVPLDRQDRTVMLAESLRAKEAIQDCTGAKTIGYRAPFFSLTKETLWALDILCEAGFQYSSSVLPAHNPLYGYPGAPRRPFAWPNGLVELPCPVAWFLGMGLPFLGGIYLRYLPISIVMRLVRGAQSDDCRWTYLHPYDFDSDAPFERVPETSVATSVLLWLNRRHTYAKVRRLIGGTATASLGDVVEKLKLSASLPTFHGASR